MIRQSASVMNHLIRMSVITAFMLITFYSCKKDDSPAPPTTDKTSIETAVAVDLTSNIGGLYQSVPKQYENTTTKYPLLIFLHSGSEIGNGTTEISKVLTMPVFARLKNGTFPATFSAGGQQFSFVVVSPQFKKWPVPADVDAVVEYSKQHLRIDPSRIYIMGCSMGGGITWEYGASYASKIAAIVPIAGASTPDLNRVTKIAAAGLPVWAFHNTDDQTVSVSNTHTYVDGINQLLPEIPAIKTIWPTGGHDAWTKAADPGYKENGKNVYEWMLQFKR